MIHPKEQKVIDDIEKQIQELSKINPETLARKDELTEKLNFESAVPLIKEYLDQSEPLFHRDLSILPLKELENIRSSFESTLSLISDIKNFQIESTDANPAAIHAQIIESIQRKRQGILGQILLPLAVTGIQEVDVDSIRQKIDEAFDTISRKNQELELFMSKSKKDAEDALNAIHESSAYAGVTANAEAFHKQSKKHFWSSFRWLIATCLSVILTAGVAIYFLNSVTGDTPIPAGQETSQKTNIPQSVPEAIQYIFAKLVIFSTLTFTIVLCSKNYKSHKHNQTLYDHRATTLDTFQAFYNGSNDEHIKDAILLQAAYAAFGNRQTGFESIQEKDSPPPMQIVDVLNKSIKTAESVGKNQS